MLNVMALNTANYHDHPGWSERLPMIVQAIIANNADVIGLSEIRYDPGNAFNDTCQQFWAGYGLNLPNCGQMDMGQQIMTLLQEQAPAAYGNATIMTNIGVVYSDGQREGLSIISRFPMVGGYVTHSQSPGSKDSANKRITQWAVITTANGNPFYLFNTHFSLDANDRLLDVQEALNLIGSALGASCCLVGDMNATPDDSALALLGPAGLADEWAAIGTGPGFTYPSDAPTKRIDYIWSSPALAPAIQSIQLVGTQPAQDGTFLSDHFGVVATFNW
jgi:endonuclease/exonuclease/phosphatase family metal-dependent hydrolase